MSDVAPEPNGHGHPTKAEHEHLAAHVEQGFAAVNTQLAFISDQVRLIGQAMELLLKAHGLDRGGSGD